MGNFKVVDFYNHNNTAAFFLSESDSGVKIDVISPNSNYIACSVDMDSEEIRGFAATLIKLADSSDGAQSWMINPQLGEAIRDRGLVGGEFIPSF